MVQGLRSRGLGPQDPKELKALGFMVRDVGIWVGRVERPAGVQSINLPVATVTTKTTTPSATATSSSHCCYYSYSYSYSSTGY